MAQVRTERDSLSATLESERESLNQELAQVRTERDDLSATLESERESLNQELAQVRTERDSLSATLENERESLNQELAQVRTERDDLSAATRKLQCENKRIADKAQREATLREEQSRQARQLQSEMDALYESAQKAQKDLNRQIALAASFKAEKDVTEQANEALRRDNENLAEQLKTYRIHYNAAIDQRNELTQALETDAERTEELSRELATYKIHYGAAIDQREELMQALELSKSHEDTLSEQKQSLLRELEAYRLQYSATVEAKEALADELGALRLRADRDAELSRELTTYKIHSGAAIDQRDELTQALELSKSHEDSLSEQKQSLLRELEAYRLQYSATVEAKEALADELGALRLRADRDAELSRELTTYKIHYSAAIDQRDELMRTLEAIQTQFADATERNRQLSANLERYKVQYAVVVEQRDTFKIHYSAAIDQRENLKRELAQVWEAYHVISTSQFWLITKPFRLLLDMLKSPFKENHVFGLLGKGIRCYRENGFRYTWRKLMDWREHRQSFASVALNQYSKEDLDAQRTYEFPRKPLISVLVPLYNTPPQFLHEMIRSVQDQTYTNWELCLADGSDEQHRKVQRICERYVKRNRRIHYRKLEKNLGISGNTNVCIEMASGEYLALFDHDDLLHPAALYEVVQAICQRDADFIYTDESTFESPKVERIITVHCKPDYAPDNLKANTYICHLSGFRKSLLDKAGGGFRSEYDGSQDHDLILRLTSQAKTIVHIPKVLYFWRSHPQSTAQDIGTKTYAIEAARNAVRASIEADGEHGEVISSRAFQTIFHIKYALHGTPLVSIIIPNKNHADDLRRCVESIRNVTTYSNYELVIVDNGSTEESAFRYYDALRKVPNMAIRSLDISFNYSAINNYAVTQVRGEYCLFLNNDTEVISPDWIQEMLMYAQRDDVAAVGAKLYYPDDTIQHAGVIIGFGPDRVAAGVFHKCGRDDIGYMGKLWYAQNVSAVTAACMLTKTKVFREVGGFDEELAVAYNDVDLCMKFRKAGYLIVWTPYAELYHYESKTRGSDATPENQERFQREANLFRERWAKELAAGDPYYNPNFIQDGTGYAFP